MLSSLSLPPLLLTPPPETTNYVIPILYVNKEADAAQLLNLRKLPNKSVLHGLPAKDGLLKDKFTTRTIARKLHLTS